MDQQKQVEGTWSGAEFDNGETNEEEGKVGPSTKSVLVVAAAVVV